ncbi:MAG: hypothetical protein KME64_43225 [Scytonematopsis contorta HA4267-MV1]|jgi:hypothetical protein|nr:hypothetical protein [Scytonematopsis contorta HA4267-MV1]
MLKSILPSIFLGILLTTSLSSVHANSNRNYNNFIVNNSNRTAIDVSKISIGGIKLGAGDKDVTKLFGKPKSRTIKYDDICYSSYVTTWKYNQAEIVGLSTSNNPNQSKVHRIMVSSPSYPTEMGVKVGDKIDKARKAYSNLVSRYERAENRGQKLDTLGYLNDAFGGLVFEVNKQGIIQKIHLSKASC